jgi:hypothetical protein
VPFLVERVKDPHVADDALTPVERGARAWRAEVLLDLGSPEVVPAAKLALVEAALGTKIVLDSLDRYLFELAGTGGLVNRRNRRAYSIVTDRMRVASPSTPRRRRRRRRRSTGEIRRGWRSSWAMRSPSSTSQG